MAHQEAVVLVEAAVAPVEALGATATNVIREAGFAAARLLSRYLRQTVQ